MTYTVTVYFGNAVTSDRVVAQCKFTSATDAAAFGSSECRRLGQHHYWTISPKPQPFRDAVVFSAHVSTLSEAKKRELNRWARRNWGHLFPYPSPSQEKAGGDLAML